MASRLPLKNSSGKYLTDYNGNCLLFNFDIAVCKAVKNMDRPKAELVSENGVAALLVTFTPIQDKQILEAVDKGLVKVRLQLLDHVASGLPEKRSDRVLIPYDYNVNFTFEGQIPEQDQRVSHRNRKAFTRRMAFRKKYYGFTWVDLTAEELAGGKAYLFSEYHDS